MSFTIKCDKCGSEQTFTSESNKYGEGIYITVYTSGSYCGETVDSIDIDCTNPKCNNDIAIKY